MGRTGFSDQKYPLRLTCARASSSVGRASASQVTRPGSWVIRFWCYPDLLDGESRAPAPVGSRAFGAAGRHPGAPPGRPGGSRTRASSRAANAFSRTPAPRTGPAGQRDFLGRKRRAPYNCDMRRLMMAVLSLALACGDISSSPGGMGGVSGGGGTGAIGGVPDASGTAPACLRINQACGGLTTCCAGTACYSDGANATCAATCAGAADCAGGCCLPLTNGAKVCSTASPCPCAQPGELCASETCCAGSVCVNNGAVASCAATCTASSQCTSGCCASLASGGQACAPASNCPTTTASPCSSFAVCLNTPNVLNPAPATSGGCDSSYYQSEQTNLCALAGGLTNSQVAACLSGSLLWCSEWANNVTACDTYCAAIGGYNSGYHVKMIGDYAVFCL